MDRRHFLSVAGGSVGVLAGCSGGSNRTTQTSTGTTSSPTDEAPTSSKTSTSSETTVDEPGTMVVAPDGESGNRGTADAPLGSVQEAVDRAEPGETVHVRPGVYPEHLETTRAGEPGDPITITGPPEAVLRHRGDKGVIINHDHIHLTGLTLDGKTHIDSPDSPEAYGGINLACFPLDMEDGGYLRDVKIMPHGVGNTKGAAVRVLRTNHLEIGEFRLIGPVGLRYLKFGKVGHFGEILYLGTPPSGLDEKSDGEVDRSHDIHVHHIDASTGYRHIGGFPDIKMGVEDVTVEYCTSVGAALPTDNDHGSVGHIGGHDVTYRWNRIVSAPDRGLDVGNYRDAPHPDVPKAATGNAIYGNEFEDLGGAAIKSSPETGPEKQRVVCGNTVDTYAAGDATESCPTTIPEGDGVGHLGGDSPWV